MLCEKAMEEKCQIDAKIKAIEEQLKQLPEGKLICSQNGKYSKWYRSDGKEKIYIPKKELQLAEKLAMKNYRTIQLKHLKQEEKAIEKYLKNHDFNACQEEQSFLNHPEYQQLLSNIYSPPSKELQAWVSAPYEKNKKYPEGLIHETYSGNLVRSKSEAMIDMFLFKNKIPFRYECALQLGEILLFPDFTIRHPRTDKLYYWEHFGLMDDPVYKNNAMSKLQLYVSNGIIPTIQLITTYETKKNPLRADYVEKLVQLYFG